MSDYMFERMVYDGSVFRCRKDGFRAWVAALDAPPVGADVYVGDVAYRVIDSKARGPFAVLQLDSPRTTAE